MGDNPRVQETGGAAFCCCKASLDSMATCDRRKKTPIPLPSKLALPVLSLRHCDACLLPCLDYPAPCCHPGLLDTIWGIHHVWVMRRGVD